MEGDDGGNGNSGSADEGALSGAFSVAAGTQVHFSKGNLQYQASTDTWRFAENQYDYVGEGNANISSTYDGWIDLFGWGTGNNPTSSSTSYSNYSTFIDWGINAISNGGKEGDIWRTLTNDEWGYLFKTRNNASTLYGHSTVNGISGMIILPDDWQSVSEISFTSGSGIYSQNTYTTEQWSKMEAAGAVFLPAAGYRLGTAVRSVGSLVFYWSATLKDEDDAYNLNIDSYTLFPQDGYSRHAGLSVRLVR